MLAHNLRILEEVHGIVLIREGQPAIVVSEETFPSILRQETLIMPREVTAPAR